MNTNEITLAKSWELIGKEDNNSNENKIQINIKKIEGTKCPRCWKKFRMQKDEEICLRCQEVVNEN